MGDVIPTGAVHALRVVADGTAAIHVEQDGIVIDFELILMGVLSRADLRLNADLAADGIRGELLKETLVAGPDYLVPIPEVGF